MLGLCTKHCTWLVLIAMVLTITLQRIPSLIHIPTWGALCDTAWTGWPFGFRPADTSCATEWGYMSNFFLNGLLNVLIFFLPLRLLHDKLLHRKPKKT